MVLEESGKLKHLQYLIRSKVPTDACNRYESYNTTGRRAAFDALFIVTRHTPRPHTAASRDETRIQLRRARSGDEARRRAARQVTRVDKARALTQKFTRYFVAHEQTLIYFQIPP
ncbi:hypothetical protein EVAR_53694_1 [Eumeta japonica]|uniref:Uncharacterized protein n=1 Tax=Eumeta variegata TaxID=151549 RepID=A0A4C1ZCZ0_EUMVA|nr:hypothetical protein EVAR_53694_1 [Eumeta japonica]